MTTIKLRTYILIAALVLAVIPAKSRADYWELRSTHMTVPGTHEIEAGKIEKGIRISKNWLSHIDKRKKVGVLTNLCVGFIVKKDFEQAAQHCNAAIRESGSKSVTYNNRGVLMAMQGRYEEAEQDFAAASTSSCDDKCSDAAPQNTQHPRAVAMRNLEKATVLANAARGDSGEQVVARTD